MALLVVDGLLFVVVVAVFSPRYSVKYAAGLVTLLKGVTTVIHEMSNRRLKIRSHNKEYQRLVALDFQLVMDKIGMAMMVMFKIGRLMVLVKVGMVLVKIGRLILMVKIGMVMVKIGRLMVQIGMVMVKIGVSFLLAILGRM